MEQGVRSNSIIVQPMQSMLNMNIDRFIHEVRNHHHHHHPPSHPHPFQFLGSSASHVPLSARQSMTDLKNLSPNAPSATGVNTTASSLSPRNSPRHSPRHSPINHKSDTTNITTATTEATTSSRASSPSSNSSGSSEAWNQKFGTPHSIENILSRPVSFGSGVTPGNSATASAPHGPPAQAETLRRCIEHQSQGALPRFSLADRAAVVASQEREMYLNAAANSNLHKLAAGLGDLSTRHLYWPQMIQNRAIPLPPPAMPWFGYPRE